MGVERSISIHGMLLRGRCGRYLAAKANTVDERGALRL